MTTDARPLAGVTVIDMTRVLAGPFCTLILSNLGARVIKVERPPHGDDARTIGPFVGGKSLYFSALNYGKESIALDLRRDEDRAIFDELLGRADVLVAWATAGPRCMRGGPRSSMPPSRASDTRGRSASGRRSTSSRRPWAAS
jgi:crotonobetainyl-CoA:carnitine CoA-transferase CaiB-like acyl-CoA transferase